MVSAKSATVKLAKNHIAKLSSQEKRQFSDTGNLILDSGLDAETKLNASILNTKLNAETPSIISSRPSSERLTKGGDKGKKVSKVHPAYF